MKTISSFAAHTFFTGTAILSFAAQASASFTNYQECKNHCGKKNIVELFVQFNDILKKEQQSKEDIKKITGTYLYLNYTQFPHGNAKKPLIEWIQKSKVSVREINSYIEQLAPLVKRTSGERKITESTKDIYKIPARFTINNNSSLTIKIECLKRGYKHYTHFLSKEIKANEKIELETVPEHINVIAGYKTLPIPVNKNHKLNFTFANNTLSYKLN